MTSLVSGLTQGETSWHGMPEQSRSETSTVLQANVEQSAYLLAEYLDNRYQDFADTTIREWHPAIGIVMIVWSLASMLRRLLLAARSAVF